MGELVLEVCGRTDVGLVREHNEDFLFVGDLDTAEELRIENAQSCDVDGRGLILVVCDGMGGVGGGEVASRLAANAIWDEMREARPTAETAVYARLLRRAIRVANQRIRDEGETDEELRGMGTTVSAAGIVGDILVLAQVGDSRAYVQRGKSLVQVTRDQSVVSALKQAGRMTESEARLSDKRSMILQALGTSDDVDVAMSIVELRAGDRLLLCSDGLHGPLEDDVLQSTMVDRTDVGDAVGSLVAKARQAGGPDNITALVVKFSGEALRPPLADDDLPRFTEFDPMEEGDDALMTTSVVARRLARRAGLRSDTAPPAIPATGQHTVVTDEDIEREAKKTRRPADRVLERGQRIGATAWLVAMISLLVLAFWLLWSAW